MIVESKHSEGTDELLIEKMKGFVNCFFFLFLEAWQKAAGLVHQGNSEKTVS